jgi:hypothetical protein
MGIAILISLLAMTRSSQAAGTDAASRSAALDSVESEIVSLEQALGETSEMSGSMRADELARSPHVKEVRARLGDLLRADTAEVRASILYARMGVALVLCAPISFNGGETVESPLPASAQDLVRALDRALLKEPNDPALHYWKSAVLVAPIVRATFPKATRSALDFEGGLRELRRAVELAPDNVDYRVTLAFDLLDLGRLEDAREAMRPAQGGAHPLYRVLGDWTRFPHPPNSTPCADARGDALTVAMRHGLKDWTNARVDAFVCTARLKTVESFYDQLFPGFRFFQIQKQADDETSVRFLAGRLEWNGESLIVVDDKDEVTNDDAAGSMMMFMAEITHPSTEVRERYGVPKGDVFCVVTLTNYHGVPSGAEAGAAIAASLSGKYEATEGDDRATLEFLEGGRVRLSVYYSDAQPRILEGEYAAEHDRIAVSFPGARVMEPGGEQGILHLTIKDSVLIALINRDENSGRRFSFTKK